MKKFSRLLSLVLAVAMLLCATSIVAFADDPEFMIDTAEFSGYVGDESWVWAQMSDYSPLSANVEWVSSDPAVATVTPMGENSTMCVVELVGAGAATITATYNGQQATMTVAAESYDEVPFNTEYPLTDDGNGFTVQFTAPEAGYYTFMFTQTNCNVYGNVYGTEFSLTTAGDASSTAVYLEQAESAIISGNAWLWDTELTQANFNLKVIASPEATGYVLDKTSVTMNFLNENICDYASVALKATPDDAPVPAGLTWKVADETIVFVDSQGAECYLTPLKVGTTTLSVYDAEENLIASIPVTVADASANFTAMEWGVLYDYVFQGNNYFTFTAKKADAYTLESFFQGEEGADPFVNVYKKTDGEWEQFDYFDDQMDEETYITTSLNFKGVIDAAEGDEFLFIVDNYQEDSYPFSIKGTAASDPGYNPVKVDAKDPTCTVDGNIEHYKCSVTGLLFANAEGTKLAGDVVVKATGHKLEKVEATKDTVAHEKCSVCGALFVDGKEVTSIDNPETGDNTMLLPLVGLVMLSATGLAVTVIGKKKAY